VSLHPLEIPLVSLSPQQLRADYIIKRYQRHFKIEHHLKKIHIKLHLLKKRVKRTPPTWLPLKVLNK
jgi:hypothetical protein